MKKSKRPVISEKEYLKTHLKGMNEMEKRWYMNAMKTWTDEIFPPHILLFSII